MKDNTTPTKIDAMPRSVTGQVVLGVLVIIMGSLFLLDNLDIIDMHRAFAFWPMVFLVVGIVKLCDTQTRGGTIFGTVMVALGLLMILDRMDLIEFNARTIWPLILIGVGAILVSRAIRGKSGLDDSGQHGVLEASDSDAEVVDVTAVMGGYERRVSSQHFRGGEVTAVMAGCVIDLRDAAIQNEAVLNVFAFWGGITLKCPPDWNVVIQGTPIMGGFEEKTARAPASSKKLVVRGYAIMGGVEVRN